MATSDRSTANPTLLGIIAAIAVTVAIAASVVATWQWQRAESLAAEKVATVNAAHKNAKMAQKQEELAARRARQAE